MAEEKDSEVVPLESTVSKEEEELRQAVREAIDEARATTEEIRRIQRILAES